MPICGGPPTGRKAEIKLGQIAVIFFVASQYSITQPGGKDPHSAAKDTFHIAPRSPFPILAPALMAGALVSTNFPFVSETHSSAPPSVLLRPRRSTGFLRLDAG